MSLQIYWNKNATVYFRKAIEYISNTSPLNAERVIQELLLRIAELSKSPLRYPLDKYKQQNDGYYRYFELNRFLVSYLVKDQSIIIVRVRHTSQKP